MTPEREAALLAVVEAAREILDEGDGSRALADAFLALDALPADPQPAPAGEVVEVAVWADPDNGAIMLARIGSVLDHRSYRAGQERLGTTLLPIRATVAGGEV